MTQFHFRFEKKTFFIYRTERTNPKKIFNKAMERPAEINRHMEKKH